VVEKSDAEVAISQGIENAARQDLSWIERAGFAATMEKAGIKARDIRAALGVDDPELARFRAVLRVLPAGVIATIGRAPKTGRPRWMALARLAAVSPERLARLSRTLAAAKVSGSDERLDLALATLRGRNATAPAALALHDPNDRLIAQASFAKGTLRLVPEKPLAAEWEAFLREDLPDLARRFAQWQADRKAE
jgi:ParB family chromosome partitioning protein